MNLDQCSDKSKIEPLIMPRYLVFGLTDELFTGLGEVGIVSDLL